MDGQQEGKMKKILLILIVIGLVTISSLAIAAPYDTIVTDVDPVNSGWWTNYTSDVNPSLKGQLINSNESTEAAWAGGILGVATGTFATWDRVEKAYLSLSSDEKAVVVYDPGFAWEYAVIKYSNYWVLMKDEGDNLLNTTPFSNGVSHVTFFNPTQIPEPSILILLGTGLLGIVGIGRRK